ncbi:MAG TPA: lipopolysaccharide kinase InaA family protein [Pseudorhodoplanes sp.]|nr:lipopolysaccharide kinase InaA family protein [Pseudorhodoplanes sp.]
MTGAKMTDGQISCELDLGGVVWVELAATAGGVISGLRGKLLPCQVLRSVPRRRVMYVPGTPALLVKQFFDRRAFDVIKTMLRGAPALQEWRALREAERRGLPVPEPFGLGRRRGQSLLLSEFVESAISLQDFAGTKHGVDTRRAIIREVAGLIRRMHDAGFYQRDLHLGNLLLRQRPEREYFLLDLQRVDVDPVFFRLGKRWRDLSALGGGCGDLSRADRLRFLRAYLRGTARLCADERRLISTLERRVQRHRLALWRSRQKRCLADNSEFVQVKIGACRGFARRAEWGELHGVIGDPCTMLARAAIVKDSFTTAVGTLGWPQGRMFVKSYKCQGPVYALKNLFRSSRARRGWKAGNSCHMRGIAVALPLAYLERRRFRFLRETYLLTAAVEGEDLARLAARLRDDFRAKRGLIRQLSRELRRMHDRGIAHRDLKAENIIAQERGGAEYRFFIVDFDGISYGPVSAKTRAKNLARSVRAVAANIPLTAADRLRFVKNYLGPAAAGRRREMHVRLLNFERKYNRRHKS